MVVLIAFIGASIVYFNRLEPRSNTTSYLQITEKGTTGQRYWVKAFDPNSGRKQAFNLTVDQATTWNLIEESHVYLATYDYVSLEKGAKLVNIEHPASP